MRLLAAMVIALAFMGLARFIVYSDRWKSHNPMDPDDAGGPR